MHEVLVNRLGGISLPRKSVVRLTDRPDMTLDVYRGRKTTMQQATTKWPPMKQHFMVNKVKYHLKDQLFVHKYAQQNIKHDLLKFNWSFHLALINDYMFVGRRTAYNESLCPTTWCIQPFKTQVFCR